MSYEKLSSVAKAVEDLLSTDPKKVPVERIIEVMSKVTKAAPELGMMLSKAALDAATETIERTLSEALRTSVAFHESLPDEHRKWPASINAAEAAEFVMAGSTIDVLRKVFSDDVLLRAVTMSYKRAPAPGIAVGAGCDEATAAADAALQMHRADNKGAH